MDIDQEGPNGSASDGQPVTGIIYPPPDIRSKIVSAKRLHKRVLIYTVQTIEMIDKAAANLATKGPELENHIRETNKDGRFNFLNPNDPYYAYYRFKYQEVKDGKGKSSLC